MGAVTLSTSKSLWLTATSSVRLDGLSTCVKAEPAWLKDANPPVKLLNVITW